MWFESPHFANSVMECYSRIMRFQQRDGDILQSIYTNDGVLAKRHIKNLYWPDKSWRAMEQRLSKLFQAEYVQWPTMEQYRVHPIPEPICYLGWRGAYLIAGKNGVEIEQPKNNREPQIRADMKLLASDIQTRAF